MENIIKKIYNFKKYIEENLIDYVPEEKKDNAFLNLGLIESLPTFLIIGGMKGVFQKEKENKEIIKQIADDYFFDLSKLNEEQLDKINRYCDYFKKYLNQ